MNNKNEQTGSEPVIYKNCEWCFQFDDEEPHPFASSSDADEPYLTFTLKTTSESTLVFTYGEKTFKLFAREKQNENT